MRWVELAKARLQFKALKSPYPQKLLLNSKPNFRYSQR
jgi:hypothetical protein